ncbi:hypothetical protein GCM10009682_18570 [Luedemannella flava]|uniref:Ribbon-helix-helix protein CopG domain-containing protein n=1 Tax=Luedemannella flava TaxID=349316 RepID=A0ABN2LRF2_9ACTN
MASQTVRFTVSDEDRARLDRLVEHFGGDRSAYLRATLTVMESLRRPARSAKASSAASTSVDCHIRLRS